MNIKEVVTAVVEFSKRQLGDASKLITKGIERMANGNWIQGTWKTSDGRFCMLGSMQDVMRVNEDDPKRFEKPHYMAAIKAVAMEINPKKASRTTRTQWNFRGHKYEEVPMTPSQQGIYWESIITQYNDSNRRTWAQVRKVMERAAKRVRDGI